MLALIQRVSSASVEVEGQTVGAIGPGVLAFLGIEKDDTSAQADRLLGKMLAYRLFPDQDNKMNLSLAEVNGGLLIVSQFTLAADTNKGLRPSFSSAAKPQEAHALYDYFVEKALSRHSQVATGVFAADMQVSLCNDGPVTFLLRS